MLPSRPPGSSSQLWLDRCATTVNAAGPPAVGVARRERAAAFARASSEGGAPMTRAQALDAYDHIDELLTGLHAVFTAPDPTAAGDLVDAGLRRWTGPVRLVTDGGARRLEAARDDTAVGRFAAAGYLALAEALISHGPTAFGRCAAQSCRSVFARTGPGRPRTTCCSMCATKHRQQVFRARHATPAG